MTSAIVAPFYPFDLAVSLTHRGEAVASLIRLRRQLAALDTEDRAYVVGLISDMVSEPAPSPEPLPVIGRCKVLGLGEVFPTETPYVPASTRPDVYIIRDQDGDGREVERFIAESMSIEDSELAYRAARDLCAELNAQLGLD